VPACGLLKRYKGRGETMIINPSANTIIPRRNSFRYQTCASSRRSRSLVLLGGKQLWYSVSKVLLASVLFVVVTFSLLNGSAEKLASEIAGIEASHAELVGSNILLRARKAQLFSSEVVGTMASSELAIHRPTSDQYPNF